MIMAAGLFCTAQTSPPRTTQAPLNRPYSQLVSFFSIRDSLDRGRSQERARNFMQARETYLALIAQLKGLNSNSFDVLALLASAEIDAARTTLALESKFPPTRDNLLQNRAEVISHAHNAVLAAYNAFVSAEAAISPSYKCIMFRVAGQAQFLEGLVETNRDSMLKGAELYTRVLKCDPADQRGTEQAIQFIRSHANEKRNDEILKTAGEFADLVGWKGKFAAVVVDAAYGYDKDHRESPFARERQ
jgi:hypothetical protein